MRAPSNGDGPGMFDLCFSRIHPCARVILPTGRRYDVRGVIILDFIRVWDMTATATAKTHGDCPYNCYCNTNTTVCKPSKSVMPLPLEALSLTLLVLFLSTAFEVIMAMVTYFAFLGARLTFRCQATTAWTARNQQEHAKLAYVSILCRC